MVCRSSETFFLLLVLFCVPIFVQAQESDEERAGVVPQFLFTNDTFGTVSGGVKRGAANSSNVDLTFDVDTEKSGLWEHGKIFSYFLAQFGTNPSGHSGALQATSNIEADDAARLLEIYYEHEFFDGKLTVLGGLHNYNSEFYLSNYAGTLINASFGLGQEIAQEGAPAAPDSALGLRVKLRPTEESYGLIALYDGKPGNFNTRSSSRLNLNRSDGAFYALEGGWLSPEEEAAEEFHKVALGAWYHDTDFEDFNGMPREGNHGVYLIVDKSLIHEEDRTQGLGVFFQLGFAEGDRNQTDKYIGAGLSYTGLLPQRSADTLVVGMARAENGSAFKSMDALNADAETTFELSYRIPIEEWLTLQPDIQYVIYPGGSRQYDDALVLGLRLQIALGVE